MGKVLFVDLTSGEIREEKIPSAVYRSYLAGQGLGAYLLYHRIPPNADPLGPENILGFMAGVLTGTGALFAGRWTVVGKSPLTGGWGDANCGGNFAPAIKRCGYDGILFTGMSKTPVYFVIRRGVAQLRDAGEIWGKDSVETEEILTSVSGCRNPRIACIGPAGENRSLISGICNDRGRLAARSGLGAVMGAKKLKAVVLDDVQRVPVHDRERIRGLSKGCNEFVQFQPPFVTGGMTPVMGMVMRMSPAQMAMDGMLYKILLKKWGTASMNQLSIEMGDAPIKNWKGSNVDFGPDKSEPLNPDVFTRCVMVRYHCYSCPLGCGGICSVSGKYSETHKPEYETVLALGGLLMNEDADSIFYLNELLNRAGMDTISAGGTVAFALECYEKGLLTEKDTGGLRLEWGNTDAIVALLEKMIHREGIGDLLADGSKIASRKIGRNAADYAIHAGGQELAMHDGRNDPGFALHNCVEPTPGRHTIGSQMYYEMFQLWQKIESLPDASLLYLKGSKFEADSQKAVAGAACSKYINVINGAGCCLFGAFLGAHRIPVFEWLNAATGWNHTPEEYLEIGARIQTLKQAFNIRHGIDPWTFKMNKRALGRPPLEAGANKGRSVDIEPMMQAYWQHFGWDPKTGRPSEEAIRALEVLDT